MEIVGTIIISGRLNDTGKILSINTNACKILNYDKNELMFNNINNIVPPYISEYHDGFILNYIETSKKHIVDSIRIVFAIINTGFLIPISLLSKIIPNLDDGIRFIGLIRKLNRQDKFYRTTDETKNVPVTIMMVKEDGVIFSVNHEVID